MGSGRYSKVRDEMDRVALSEEEVGCQHPSSPATSQSTKKERNLPMLNLNGPTLCTLFPAVVTHVIEEDEFRYKFINLLLFCECSPN